MTHDALCLTGCSTNPSPIHHPNWNVRRYAFVFVIVPLRSRDALDALGLTRYCCRRMVMTHVGEGYTSALCPLPCASITQQRHPLQFISYAPSTELCDELRSVYYSVSFLAPALLMQRCYITLSTQPQIETAACTNTVTDTSFCDGRSTCCGHA